MGEISKQLEQYFLHIEQQAQHTLKIATQARVKGYDPEDKVDIPIAKNMAERVLGLVSDVAPQLADSDVVTRVVELEKKYGALDWRVGFIIAAEIAQQKFCTFPSKKDAVEVGIRTGFSYLTGGIVSAPLEGFVEVKIKKRSDGKEYIASSYAGPIRGAGGTAAATSVVLSDYVATQLGYAKYDPSDDEVNRIITELTDYNERVTNLQYFPSPEEIRFMVSHLPVEVDGEQTERIEVSNYKDLERIDTNFIRGGVCLVIGEGLCQKAPKIWKRLGKWGKDLGIDWTFLEEFLSIQKKVKAKGKKQETNVKSISPNYTFINDIVAGRPVLSYPLAPGGFRVRLGRTRVSGFSSVALNPYTLAVLDDFIVYGTQLKIERPGKAGSVTICEAIEGPTVLLDTGEVVQITKENRSFVNRVKEILFLGDMLINYGDFSENGHSLVPLGYCEEWWVQDVEKRAQEVLGELNISKLAELTGISSERLDKLFTNPFSSFSFTDSMKLCKKLDVPLHPHYLFFYSLLTIEDVQALLAGLIGARQVKDEATGALAKLIIEDTSIKQYLEKAGIFHECVSDEFVVLKGEVAQAIAVTFGINNPTTPSIVTTLFDQHSDKSVLELINILSDVIIKDKAGTFVGARMGRPEKSKMRKLQGSPQVLFPVGEEGGRLRCFQSAMDKGEITSDFPIFYDTKAKRRTIYRISHLTGEKAKRIYYCPNLNKELMTEKPPIDQDPKAKSYMRMTINIKEYIESCLKMLNTKVYPDIIKGVKGTSNKEHVPEHLIKGFLRAKHDIYVNKDGTTRYDMSEAPMTAFKPREIGTSIERLKELGYTHDMDGNPLDHDDQVVELFPQDVVLPAGEALEEQADDIIFRIGQFVDDLLITLYQQKPFYQFKSKQDIVGHLIVCLAPHISCGTIGRIVGFSKNQVMLAHPLMHAAVRRDCDGDEACFIMLMDAFLNFSRKYLPDKRGGRTMDAPLVLSVRIIPSEVDDQVHGVDVVRRYPLELYEKASFFVMPWDVPVKQLKDALGTENQYEGFHATHPVQDINLGPKVSAYKVLPSMQEKLDGQMKLAAKIRAVDAGNVATMVINKHFLRDIKGNLRKFSQQEFRCVQCNEKYRRPPLGGRCTKDGGKLIFTISEGSVVKYLGSSLELCKKYSVPIYLKQTLELTLGRVESVFGKEKEKQEGLAKFF